MPINMTESARKNILPTMISRRANLPVIEAQIALVKKPLTGDSSFEK
jgi:hypothetical protein